MVLLLPLLSARAVAAPVRHRLVLDAGLHVKRPALRAVGAIRPTHGLDPFPRHVLVTKHVCDFQERQSLTMRFAR